MMDIDTSKVKCHIKVGSEQYDITLDKLLRKEGIDLPRIRNMDDYQRAVDGIFQYAVKEIINKGVSKYEIICKDSGFYHYTSPESDPYKAISDFKGQLSKIFRD